MNNESRKWLYDNLRMKGYNVGNTYEDFSKLMDTNEQSRKWAYDRARELGYNVGKDYEQFNSLIGPEVKQQPVTPSDQSGSIAPVQDSTDSSVEVAAPVTTVNSGEETQQQDGVMPTPQQSMAYQMQSEDIAKSVEQSQKDFSTRMENIRKGNTLGQTSELKFNPVSGTSERSYYTTQGDEVSTPTEQSRLNLKYRDEWETNTPEGQAHREQRIQNDYEGAVNAALSKFDPDNTALQVWQQTEDRLKSDIDKHNAEIWENYAASGMYGREFRTMATGEAQHSNAVDQLKHKDLQKMADEAWDMLGKDKQQAIIDDLASALHNRYPQATDEQIQQAAVEMARQQSDRRMFEVAVEKNAPKSATDFFFRKALGQNSLVKIGQALARSSAGTTGDWEAREEAEQRYEKQGHKAVGIAGAVTGFAIDPLTMLSAGVGGASVKGATWLGGKMIGETATREFATTLAGRMLGGVIGGATNFATFEGGGEALDQLKWGSYMDEETGERKDGFSFGNVAGRAGHGLVMGSVTGMIAPLIGNVSDKLVKATESTAGKLAIRTGELGVGTVAEGTIFAVPELAHTAGVYDGLIESLSDENNPNYIADEQLREAKIEEIRNSRGEAMLDVWTDNMAMMAGFKLQHGLKSAPRVIAELSRIDNPLNMAQRIHNRMGFESRLRAVLDGTQPDLALTKDEKDELERHGYTDLKELTEGYKEIEQAKKDEGVDEYGKDAPLPYNRFSELMSDGSISEAARAKLYYYLTGHALPMSTVMGSTITENKDADGNVQSYTVESFGANGVITSRTFGSKKRADVEVNRINRQAELNGFDVGERHYDWKADKKRMEEACEAVAAEIGAPVKSLFELMNRKQETMNEVEAEWAEKILDAYEELGDRYGSSELRTVINEEFGVDVDKAIGKERNRRSEQEQKAVEEYAQRLFADVMQKQQEVAVRGEAPVDPDAPTSDAKIAALLGVDDDEPTDPIEKAFKRGYDADTQERQDIAIELTDPDNTEAQEAWNGVVQRINEDAAYMAAQQREETKKMQHKSDGSLRPAILKENDAEGNTQHVYIVDGNVQTLPDGSIDKTASDNIIVVYNPATGESKQIDPTSDTGLSTLGGVTTAEQREAEIERGRQAYVQALLDEAQGTVRFYIGDHLTLPTGEEAVVVAIDADGENATVALGDGTQSTVQRSELQRMRDEAALADYRQRHGVSEEQPTESVSQSEQTTGGAISGAPADYTDGIELVIRDEDGTEKPAMVMGRVRFENGQFVPDPNGSIVEYLMDGDVNHEHISKIGDKVVSHIPAQQPEPVNNTPENIPVEGNNGGENIPQTPEQQIEQTPEAQVVEQPDLVTTASDQVSDQVADAMPMVGEGDDAEPDFMRTTPQRGHQFIYDEAGLSRDEANQFVANNIEASNKNLDKVRQKTPKMGTSIAKFNKDKAAWQQQVSDAQAAVEYWTGVKAEQDKRIMQEREAQRESDAVTHDAAVEAEQQRQAEEIAKREEQAERGANAVAPAIREKWEAAPKIEGNENEITLANGERVKGRYVLVESGAATPSHNPNMEFARNEGFPVDENGQTVNDRDYERDMDAQEITRNMGAQYDSRAIQNVPVVSNDGVVLSGNGRTMAGELAAQNNSDGAYIDHLEKYPQQFGFTTEQVQGMQHPRVVFVPDEAMPYTTDTFAKFNQQDMKSQSRTEQSVKLGKTVDDATFGRIIQSINTFDSLNDFYQDPTAATNAIGELRSAGAINAMQYAEMFDGEKVSGLGRQMLENMLIGKAFESNPDAIRQLSEFPAMRQSVISALSEITNNIKLGKEYSVEDELAGAINLAYQARKSGTKSGEPVSWFARQLNLFPFDMGETVADYTNATVLMLADQLNGAKVNQLKNWMAIYNHAANDAANGQLDLFNGGVKSKDDIIKEALNVLDNGTEAEQRAAINAAKEQRKAAAAGESRGSNESVQQDDVSNIGEPANDAAEVNEQTTNEPNAVQVAVAAAEAETNTEPTDAQKEAGNYKKGHLKIDGYDVTIENPKGSERSGTDASGKKWSVTMNNTYGYIRGTEGVDGDHIDVFLSDDPSKGNVFVVDQVKADGTFDEHKVMYGFPDIESAREAYLSNYSEGWKGLGAITPVSKEEFKKWIDSSHRKTKPFAEYGSVKPLGDTLLGESASKQIEPDFEPKYTVTPKPYTTKRGKVLDMQLLQFPNELSKEQQRAAASLARELKGWWSKEDHGFLMRSVDDAEQLVKTILDEDAVQDAQPLSVADVAKVNDKVVETQESLPQPKQVNIESLVGELNEKGKAKLSDHTTSIDEQPKQKGSGISTESWNGHKVGDVYEDAYGNKARIIGFDYTYGETPEVLVRHLDEHGNEVQTEAIPPLIFEGELKKAEQPKEEKGETANEQPKQEEQKAKSKWVDDEDAERFEKLRQRLHKKIWGQLNVGVDPEVLAIGVEMSYLMLKHGARKFHEFAKNLIEALGEEVRPYIKAFYNGARDMPEMAEYEKDMTPYEEVRQFDVMNFDKDGAKDMIATAEHVVREQTVEREAKEATNQLKEQRNEQRKEIEQQIAADTETVASQAETVASEVETKLTSARSEQEVNDLARSVDDALEQVNEQLAVLGYYKADPIESDFNEAYGYMRNAEKKAVKNVTELCETLTAALGLSDSAIYDGNGRKQKSVVANIAPAGGDVTMRFMINRQKGVELYMDFMLEPDGDNLELRSIMFRPEKGRDTLRANNYFNPDVTLPEMLQGIRSVCREWLPQEDYVSMAERISAENAKKNAKNSSKEKKSKKKSVSLQQQTIPDLFSGLFGEDLNNNDYEQEVHVQSGSSSSERESGHQRGQNEPLGEGERHEDERTDARRVVGRSGSNSVSDTERGASVSESSNGKQPVKSAKPEFAPLSESERRNTHNNHAERGTDYAPKSTNARIEANIAAIETMQRLIESGQPATPEDMSVLRKFSGWGGLGAAFKEKVSSGDSGYNPRLRDDYQAENPINKRLRELLSPEAYKTAVDSRYSAYYTPAPVIDAMWDVARAMGFRGGNVLEGSAGIGNILGLMPTDMSERSDIHAVEIDETTGNILSLLYPDANVEIKGFEKTRVPNGSVDLAITNVPFITDWHVRDETGDKDLSKKFSDIHNFCIAKNVRKLKEGGIGIFITSSGTLDNPNSAKLRSWIVNEGNSDVVGAFRMHNQTFGGTGATSDIIVIRKRVNGQKSANAIDVSGTLPIRTVKYDTGETKRGSSEVIVKDLALDVNKHFVEHPEDMAGEMAFAFEKGDTYRATSKALYPSESINQEKRLAEWAQKFRDMDWDKAEEREIQQVVYEDLGEDVKEGSMLLDSDGNLCLAQRGKAVPIGVNANKVKGHTKAECFKLYKAIKDALADVLEYQTTHSDDNGLKQRLDVLNRTYDNFVKTYGHLNKNTSISFLRSDMDYPSIAALESVSETGDKSGKRIVTYGKTDIFSHRVVEAESEPKPTTIKDGIIASIYLNGRVDVPYIAEQLGLSETDVRQQIVDGGLGFENPTTTEMEVSYEYLSGNVREKLRQARENNADGRYDANIKALERVIPMNIPAHLIEFTLGSSWVEPKLYEDYVKERTGLDVKLTNAGGTWIMHEPYWTNTEQNKAMGVISEKCDKTILGHELINAAITCKSISVTKTITTGYGSNKSTETIVDKEATMACANKIDEIRQDFKDWARGKMQSDPEMSERMERVYNDLFNNNVPLEIPDEFVPEHFGGAATVVNGKPFQLRPHQAKAVIRGTTQPLLLAHEVGTGKTYTLISTAMEMRRLGTARKPMIVVQNATVGQFVASAKSLYPNAKILTLEDADRNAEGRRNFYAKIRYNDWDMIVVPQSVFERIPDSEERQIRFIEDKVEEKIMVLEMMREAADDDHDPVLRQAQRELDQLNDDLNDLKLKLNERKTDKDEKREAKTRQNATVKAQEMLDRETDDVANFDDMGIDALLIDEAHEYKHLGFATAMQRGVKGVDPSFSKKSQGVYLKTQAVLENKNGKNVVFATGTPISNTAAEIWTFMRYLMPADTMREYGIYYFDDFVRNFGNIQQMLEFSTNGKYKENNRFAGYVNLPELVRIWAGVADTVLTREAGGVSDKIPKTESDKAQDIYLPQTKALRSVMKYVKKQLDDYEKMSGKEKKENSHIPLVMYGIAKAAAVDARLVLEDAADEPNSKTNEAVRQTLRSLEDTKDYNGTVAIFADNYQNKATGFNLYEDIRKKLIEAGVPETQVVVMKSGMSIKKKLEIFDKVNRGEVRVIMGSTFTLGTGVNIQERLHTLIHVDAPNRPMDYTQRNGRILRQGNLHNEWGIPVRVLRFGVEDSLDVTAYQRLKTKGAIADSIMEGKKMMGNSMENRVLEEEQDLFGDITAQLSGSQYAMLKNQVEKEVKKLEARKKQYEADQTYVHNQKPRLKSLIKEAEERAERNKKALAKVEAAKNDGITIGKMKFPSLDAMADYIKDYNSKQREQQEQVRTAADYNAEAKSDLAINVGGFDFNIHRVITKEQKQEKGQLSLSFISKTQMTYSCSELGLEDVPVDGQRLKSALEDIVNNVMSGNDFRERMGYAERAAERYKGELQQVEARDGKPFEYADELKQAKEKLAEYEELMKAEMAEKEAKYAEIDASVEAASDVKLTDEESDDVSEDTAKYRIREDEPPTKTGIGYKVFVLKDGKLYPPMVANPNGAATPVGVWLDADAAPVAGITKTGRQQVKAGGKGTQGGSGKLAYRPGWHLGEIPYALQFNRINPETGQRELFPANFVWAEVEYADDVDYQEEAMSYGMNASGKFQHSLAGLPRLPENGSYKYRTNPDPNTDPWIITGAMKVNRILKPSEVDAMVEAAGREPQQRQADAITDEQVEALNANVKRTMQEDTDMKRRTVEQMGEKLHANINIIEDVESITHPNATVQERRRKSKGWYDTATGQVNIVLSNHKNVEDVAATVAHETIAHKGLRELVGEENYDEFLDETYKHLRDDLKKGVDDAAGRAFMDDATKNGNKAKTYEQHRRTATDELFGKMAEKPFEEFSEGERTLWQRIKDTVRRLLDKFLGSLKLPKWFTLGDNELRYILWRSKERLERSKEHPIDVARDIVKREELGLSDDNGIYSDTKKDVSSTRLQTSDDAQAVQRNKHLSGTKVEINSENKEEISENLSSLAKKVAETQLPAEKFLAEVRKAMKTESDDHSGYSTQIMDGEMLTMRISDHHANAKHNKQNDEFKVVSVVVKTPYSNNRFRPHKEVEMVEYTFDADKLTHENEQSIVAGIRQWLETGQCEIEGALTVRRSPRPESEETAVYRDGDETEDIWNDKSMGLDERITAAATRLANRHSDDNTLRYDAMRAIGGNLSKLRSAMSLQRTFDKTTVKRVADLARVLMDSGYLNGLTRQEVVRLLAAVKNSVGHNDIERDVQKVMDIMIDNQLRNAEYSLDSLMSIRGSKVDARGVEVQGKLDPEGAHIMHVFKKAHGWEKGDIEDAIADAQQRMSSSDVAVADEAALEYTGLQLAKEYAENIKDSKVDERKLREEIKQAHNEASERERATDSYIQYIASLQEAIRQNKIERAESYFNLVGRLSDSLRESIENAKAFKEAEQQRIAEIQHNANSDMQGRPSDEHYKPKFADKFVNNSFVSFVFAPLATFDQMLRMFGGKSANGEGYLYNRFMRGWVDARQKEIKGVREKYAILDAKAAEIFGGKVKTWGDLIRSVGKLPKTIVSFWNGGEMQNHELSQGNLMYIYMVNKMTDGRMKLRRMGITEEDVADIEEVLDNRLINLADWLQDEFLVQTRNEYNETHKRMFGASMAAIEHYFPLKILANARADKPEDLDNPDKGDGISTATGSIIKRRRNALALDITGADALNVILDHVAQMEHWNAYAEFNRDLNTLRTYRRFRNQVQNMTTIYGSGKELWRKFNDVCQMAAGTYRPPRAKLDEAATNFAKGVTAAKVSFRIFTALKQFLSAPAYIPEVRPDYLLANMVNPVKAWKWSMEHLPIFNERWHSRMAGDPRLLKSDMDWKMWRTHIVQLASRAGMSPNAFVDALTVSIGAHSIYQTRFGQYLRDGYSQADAEKKAIQDAEVLYNETQQSSEGAFTSTMQVDRSWLSVLFTVFRNASMSYQRQLHDALRNLKHNLTAGGRARSIEFMKKQYVRDGIDEVQAERNAKRKFGRQLMKDTLRVATFGYIMQLAWNLGPYLYYMLFGDDEDEKQKMWDDVWAHTAFGWLEGLTGGDVASQAGEMLLTGEGNPAYLSKDMPLTSDIASALQKLGNGKHTEALNDIVNLVVQSGLGFNPQSITDGVLSIMDACGDDPALAHEAAICIMRILQMPQSQIDKIYFDEVGLSGEEVSKYTPVQLAERYARFKVKRGNFFAPWSWDDEESIKKFTDKAKLIVKERTEKIGDPKVNEAYLQYEEIYKGIDEQVKAANKMAKSDYVKAAQLMAEAQSDREKFATYNAFKTMDGNLDKIAKFYLASKTPEEAALCKETIVNYKSAMVKVLEARTEKEHTDAINALSSVMENFSAKYVPMQ